MTIFRAWTFWSQLDAAKLGTKYFLSAQTIFFRLKLFSFDSKYFFSARNIVAETKWNISFASEEASQKAEEITV